MRKWPWEMTDVDLAWAACADRFGKSLDEMDDEPWPEVGRLLNLLEWEAKIENGHP